MGVATLESPATPAYRKWCRQHRIVTRVVQMAPVIAAGTKPPGMTASIRREMAGVGVGAIAAMCTVRYSVDLNGIHYFLHQWRVEQEAKYLRALMETWDEVRRKQVEARDAGSDHAPHT